MTNAVEDRLLDACRTGDSAALADWAMTGRSGLLVLRDWLSGDWKPGPIEGHPKDLIDNTTAAVAAIAGAHPSDFLDVFEADRFLEWSYVLTGLGQIDDPRATERLTRAAGSDNQWNRMHAAIGLARRASPAVSATLGRLVGDQEYLVRYHALKSLGRIGDVSVLPILRRLKPDAPYETDLVQETISTIEGRAAEGHSRH